MATQSLRQNFLDEFETQFNLVEAGPNVAAMPPPQAGPQSVFMATDADIALFGGGAGGGKSWALLLDFAQHTPVPGYGGIIFRRTFPQIKNEGGLWDEAAKLYPLGGAKPLESRLEWSFPGGSTVRFAHLQHEKNIYDWQGAQLCRIGFDELTHFSKNQFFYLLSRARTTIGIKPQVRATCNPDADSWVAGLVDWWLDEAGYAIPERSGVVRWFVNVNGELHWGDRPEDLADRFPGIPPKSFTFIPSRLTDNKILCDADPGYFANLMAQHPVERARLLDGNWKVRHEAGKFINRGWYEILDSADIPDGGIECRFWDFAATEKQTKGDDPDWTVGVKMRKVGPLYFVVDVIRLRADPAEVERTVINTAAADGRACIIGFEQEPGAAGKQTVYTWRQLLRGFVVRAPKPNKNKLERAKPFAVESEGGNVKMKRAAWNDEVLSVLHAVPDGPHDDDLDAAAGAYRTLLTDAPPQASGLKLY